MILSRRAVLSVAALAAVRTANRKPKKPVSDTFTDAYPA